VTEIPRVIDAARAADLVNIGGQLQFRFPDGAICECYWVEVDTYKAIPEGLSWSERVSETAAAALSQFQQLHEKYDFIAEGRSAFERPVEEFEAHGGDFADTLCFVWYVEAKADAANRKVS
jgi:hypothetical protein